MEFGPQAITMGPVQIRYYGIIIVTAILIAAMLAARLAKRDGRDPEHIWGAMFGAVILGIVFARLWFVLFPPISLTAGCADTLASTICRDTAWFFNNFFNTTDGAIAIWSGGLHIFGAFIGGFLGSYIYFKRSKLPVLPWLDIAAVGLPLGQAIGRFANYVNQELYGLPTNLPWGINIDLDRRIAPYNMLEYRDSLFHPLFAYEAILNFILFLVLLNLWQNRRKTLRAGTIFLLYVAGYSAIRFVLEFLRVEVSLVGGINIVQVITAVTFLAAVALLATRQRQPVTEEERAAMRDPEPVKPEIQSEKKVKA
jgi:phosphatidylglycerol---prolipoprotein diacylglyceryl transferase